MEKKTLIDSSMTIEEICAYAVSKGDDVTIWIKANGDISLDVDKAVAEKEQEHD